jgi:hypothetical protein
MNMRKEDKKNRSSLLISLSSTLIVFFILYLWRKVSQTNLLYDQIVICSTLILMINVLIGIIFSKKLYVKVNFLRDSFIVALLFYTFGSAILLNIDRSRSLYIFPWIGQCDNRISCLKKSLLPNQGVQGWLEVEQRLIEQDSRKLMEIQGDTITLTIGGRMVLTSANLFANIFELEGYKNARINEN